jgi:hypothetical protein
MESRTNPLYYWVRSGKSNPFSFVYRVVSRSLMEQMVYKQVLALKGGCER